MLMHTSKGRHNIYMKLNTPPSVQYRFETCRRVYHRPRAVAPPNAINRELTKEFSYKKAPKASILPSPAMRYLNIWIALWTLLHLSQFYGLSASLICL
ncbi:hypothetical protein L596_020036 [Steinernema carpocapsae]|uniref:Uncharacterized protein n=1 Tax=Steinernema carpocapsae TaxID=34508 RepID=A0A4U5MSB6_STECR|nr:hypothetical protein L596_020036 [Steinernema carpocapsae]